MGYLQARKAPHDKHHIKSKGQTLKKEKKKKSYED